MHYVRKKVKGQVVLIDKQDEALFLSRNWLVEKDCGYVRCHGRHPTTGKPVKFRLHRLILDPPPGMLVDHINRNKLDNRRCNLRLATPEINARNKTPKRKYLGVTPHRNSWVAQMTANYQSRYLGCFKTVEEAARAYDRAVKGKPGARLNFPEEQ